MKRLLAGLVLLVGCSNAPAARQTLEAEGYTDIRVGYWEFGCAQDDAYCTGFEAIGPSGKLVHGVVGCGLVVKGCTVRITTWHPIVRP